MMLNIFPDWPVKLKCRHKSPCQLMKSPRSSFQECCDCALQYQLLFLGPFALLIWHFALECRVEIR